MQMRAMRLIGALCMATLASGVAAQSCPNRPTTVVVPGPAVVKAANVKIY
jgi:tripartite-type tricarboxylate transporter receptor subunit TctC